MYVKAINLGKAVPSSHNYVFFPPPESLLVLVHNKKIIGIFAKKKKNVTEANGVLSVGNERTFI